ncbi:Rne/Rng family ribonuclease [Corynebacterium sphenisci]|uniref:Rne/Rng family ribonuclease n=1 Tax=Corynebacterium sphenisci TaxID=191493 RepID=UPI0026DFB02D|nr:translation initiation factor IF-2 N-terminal domain-containing protein [Corynebacterium sphenisci]MDO5730315.1 translation initiation factor IF-2 N-terminal domain-containing protein [Corynebacterium sphenisci]
MAEYSQENIALARDFDRAGAPERMRVHALAKAIGLTSKEVIGILDGLGVAGKRAASTVEVADRNRVLDTLIGSAGSAKQEQAKAKATSTAKDKDAEPKQAAPKKKAAPKTRGQAKAQDDAGERATGPTDGEAADEGAQTGPSASARRRARRRRKVVAAAPTGTGGDGPAAEQADAPAAAEDAAEAERAPAPKKTTRTRSRRAVRRQAAAPAEDAPVEVVEPTIAAVFAEPAEEGLTEVVPPVTPAPEEPSFEVPVFMAPQAVPAAERPAGDDDAADDRAEDAGAADSGPDAEADGGRQPRRRRRGRGRGAGGQHGQGGGRGGQDTPRAEEVPVIDEPAAIKGSTRLEAQRRRRADRREQSRRRPVISEAEFLARRESVKREMVVRERRRTDHPGTVTQVGVLEDDLLVEHFVTSDTQSSMIGNIYLGRVQNVLPSMEAAFIDIGTDRNGVVYSADLNWRQLGLGGRGRRIEQALRSGDQILVQVTKDPVGHKGPRLSMQISLAGRYLVYVPGGHSAGISRKLPESERKRLKEILKEVTPEGSGTIIRTAAEGVGKEAIRGDVDRLEAKWQGIAKRAEQAKAKKGSKPETMYEEPNMLVKVVRDLFNEDFDALVVDGEDSWRTVRGYISDVAPDLMDRVHRYDAAEHDGKDAFATHRIDEQLTKALDRKVWLPSGGTLIIERTEAMTVVDVNTGKFTGAGGNLEETVTRNNLEAAEEIVRQMRLRDLGGMIVVDFIDMVLPENQDLVLRRLKEALGRDRTRHEVSEVTSLGLVQMTRKRLGTGLLETFSTECPNCAGRGLILHVDPVEQEPEKPRSRRSRKVADPTKHPAALALHKDEPKEPDTDADRARATEDTATQEATADAADPRDRPDDAPGRGDEGAGRPTRSRRRRRSRRGSRRGGAADAGQEPRERRAEDADAEADGSAEGRRDDYARREDRGRRDDRAERDAREERRARRERAERDDREDDARGEAERPEQAPSVDRIAEVAAAATAEARDKDPEEPSDDRYVSASARRRRRRRVVRAAQRGELPAEAEPKRGGPEGGDRAQDEPTRERPAKKDEPTRERPAKKDEPVREQPRRKAEPTRDEPAEAAPAKDGAEQPTRGRAAYEAALAAFEASPRRKRPTRGRSRSDHAPDPEDYGLPASAAPKRIRERAAQPAPEPAAPEAKPAQAGPAAEAPAAEPAEKPRRRRGRRRVAVRTSGIDRDGAAPAPSAKKATPKSGPAAEPAGEAPAAESAERPARAAAETGRPRRRGRRRVTRKLSG